MEGAGEPLNAVHIHSVELISFSVGDGTSVVVCSEVSMTSPISQMEAFEVSKGSWEDVCAVGPGQERMGCPCAFTCPTAELISGVSLLTCILNQ